MTKKTLYGKISTLTYYNKDNYPTYNINEVCKELFIPLRELRYIHKLLLANLKEIGGKHTFLDYEDAIATVGHPNFYKLYDLLTICHMARSGLLTPKSDLSTSTLKIDLEEVFSDKDYLTELVYFHPMLNNFTTELSKTDWTTVNHIVYEFYELEENNA